MIYLNVSLFRPAAKDARISDNVIDYDTKFIYDDDAIEIISKTLGVSNSVADKFRRCITKINGKVRPDLFITILLTQYQKNSR